MPWKKDTVPDGVKVLPAPAINLWVGAANGWLTAHPADDVTAVQVGWDAVGKKYKKVGNNWVVKTAEEIDNDLLEINDNAKHQATYRDKNPGKAALRNKFHAALKSGKIKKGVKCQCCDKTGCTLHAHHPDYRKPLSVKWLCRDCEIKADNGKLGRTNKEGGNVDIHESLFTPIDEVIINEAERKITLNIIKAGWSKNSNFWTLKHLDQFKKFIEGRSRKQYIDHKERARFGRSTLDWIATLESPRIEYTKDNTAVLRAETQFFEHPESAEAIWERAIKAPDLLGVSVDAAATGKRGTVGGQTGFIPEDVKALFSSDFVTEASAGGGVTRVGESIVGHIFGEEEIEEGEGTDGQITDEGLIADTKNIEKFDQEIWATFYSFQSLVRGIIRHEDLSPADKSKKLSELVSELKVEIGKIKIPKTPKITEEEDNKLNVLTVKESVMDIKTLRELEMSNPALYASIVKEAEDKVAGDLDLKAKLARLEVLETENKSQAEKITAFETSEKTLKDEKTKLTKEVDDFKVKESAIVKKEKVDKAIAESKIVKDAVTEAFVNDLLAVAEGDDFDAKIAEKIKDRKAVYEAGLKRGNPGFTQADLENKEPVKVKEGSLAELYKKVRPAKATA